MHTSDFKNRFTRQEPILGLEGQKTLQNSKIIIVGLGGLGCPASLYLSQAGIGAITIVDHDIVDETNLHRQILFTEKMIGHGKAVSAKKNIELYNSHIFINDIAHKLDKDNAFSLCMDHDLILDCTDNFESKYLLNQTSKELKIPLISASIFQSEASILTLNINDGPCLECIFPEKPPLSLIPNCSQSGVLGIDVGIVGLFQAKEAVNILMNGSVLHHKIMTINLQSLTTKIRDIKKSPHCSSISCNPKNYFENNIRNIDINKLKILLNDIPHTQLIDVRSKNEHKEFNIGGYNIPLDQMANQINRLDPHITTIVYCQSGKRSSEAARYLIEKGFVDVFNLEWSLSC